MKKNLKVSFVTMLLGVIFISGCSKKDEPTPVITPNTPVTSTSYFGVGTVKHSANVITYILQGDSTAYMIMAGPGLQNDSSFMYMKGYGSDGPGTPMTTGTYNVVSFCDTCSYTLQPFDVILLIGTNEGGGTATSGTLDIIVNNGKPTVTFSDITLNQTTLKGFGKIIVP